MRTVSWLVVAAAVVMPDAAWACSCFPVSPCARYARADAIFMGTILAVEQEGSAVIAHLDVTRTWKGTVDRKVTLREGARTSCSFEYVVGQRFVVYGSGSVSEFRPNMCLGGGLIPPGEPEPDLPPRAGRVAGIVLDLRPSTSAGYVDRPITNARVSLETRGGVRETRTDAKGQFTFDGVPAGSHNVRADVGNAFEAASGVTLQSPSDCAAVLITPRPSGRFGGVLVSRDGASVAGTEVYVVPVDHDWTKRDLSDSRSAKADDSGRFEFAGVRPGRYVLTINVVRPPRVSQPFSATYYPGVDRRENAFVVDVGEGQAPSLQPFLLPRALPLTTIAIDIVCRDGSMPRSGLAFARRIPEQSMFKESTYEKVDGHFRLKIMAGVPYEVYGEVLVDVRDAAGRVSGFTGLPTPPVRVEPGTASTVRVIAPLDRCQETTVDGSRPGGR